MAQHGLTSSEADSSEAAILINTESRLKVSQLLNVSGLYEVIRRCSGQDISY